jgi:3-deoxy-D-manno-octulosonate 8-phosphate phosphatase (KDO 8-P phosphatase)
MIAMEQLLSLQNIHQIKAVVSDVDGVLTDGSIVVGPQGETKTFSVRDGLGISLLQKSGLAFALLSGRASAPVETRARELGIAVVKTGRLDKQTALLEIAEALNLGLDQIAYIGDDLPDLAPLQMAAVSFCPRDAVAEIQACVDEVVPAAGGRGAVRYVCERILKAQNLWDRHPAFFEVKRD